MALAVVLTSTATAADRTPEVEQAAVRFFDGLLEGRALEWTIEVRRCPTVEAGSFAISGVRYEDRQDLPRGTTLCWVDVVADGRERSLPVTLTVKPVELVPVACEDLDPRTPLVDSLLIWRELGTENLGRTAFPRRERLEEYWTRARIPRGEIVSMNRLAQIPRVKLGEQVAVLGRSGDVEVKTTGKALQDGFTGERIRVELSNNHLRLRGLVQPNGSIVVE